MKLHIKAKIISLHGKMDVLDEQENLVYKIASKAVSIHDKTYIKDAEDRDVAYIHAKAVSIHNVHYVEMADGVNFEVKAELFHLKDVINIEELGWQLRGNFMSHDFQIADSNERVIAQAHRKWLSMHGIYYLDIIDEEKADTIIAVYTILEHMISARDAAAASGTAALADIESQGN